MSRIPSVRYTKRFDEVGKDDLALAGGKGANLGKFSRARLPVPGGSAPHRSSLRGADRSLRREPGAGGDR